MNFYNSNNFYFAITFTLVFILYITLILNRVSACFTLETGSNSLGLSFYYTRNMVQDFFSLRNEDQLICYSQFLKIWDPIFAIIYTLMYLSWIGYLLKNKLLFLIVPILAMVSDWVENFLELLLLNIYTKSNLLSEIFIIIGSGVNSLKWILSTLTYLLILYGIIITLKNLFIKSKKNSV